MLSEKYRPTCFDDVVGNKEVVDAIKNSLDSKIGCRTVFITGPNGVGKSTLARIIAMNLRNVKTEEELKRDFSYYNINCTRFGSVSDIRIRVENLLYKGFGGAPVIYIFDECSSLSKESQKVLLESIEDPDLDFNYFIFTTADPDKMIPDLLDRLTERRLEHVTRTDILRNLERIIRLEELDVDKNVLINIASNCNRKIRKSIQLLEDYVSMPSDKKALLIRQLKKNNDKPTKPAQVNHDTAANTTAESSDSETAEEDHKVMATTPLRSDDNEYTTDIAPKALITTNENHDNIANYLEIFEQMALTSAQILRQHFPKPQAFIEPFIRQGSLIMVFAKAGVGKSWFALTLALALTRSNGPSFKLANYKVVNQCGVLYLDGELSGYEIKARLSLLAGPFGEENPNTPLRILSSEELVDELEKPFSLDDKEWRDSIYLYLKNNPQYKKLIIDNLSSLCGGNSENSRKEITEINRWLYSVRRLGASVTIVHHANKAGDFRGHSSKVDNLHTVINLTSEKDTDELAFRVKYTKGRHAERGDLKEFVAEAISFAENPDWMTWNWYYEESPDLAAPNNNDQIMCYIMEHGNVTQGDIAELFNVSQAKVSNCKRKAIKAGYITEEKEITEAGKKFLDEHKSKSETETVLDLAA